MNISFRSLAALTIAGAALTGATAVAAHAADGDSTDQAAPTKIAKDLWAVVEGKSGGVAFSNNHVRTSQRLAEGFYVVTFDRNVDACAYSATPTAAFAGDIARASTGIAVNPDSSARDSLLIFTQDLGDDSQVINDSSFSIIVDCANP